MSLPPNRRALLLVLCAMLLTGLIYLPGLAGPWLVDDEANIGVFHGFAAGQAPYQEIIFSNSSGPLGRSVAMASFALNHALDLFDSRALKASNLLIHLANGLLLYLLLARLFRQRNPAPAITPACLAAAIATWWLLLPQHINTVLYIVQRMTELAAFFSLATCQAYVAGRQRGLEGKKKSGSVLIALALLLLFPLALYSKESAFSCLAWIFLIELFFFAATPAWRTGSRNVLAITVALVTVAGIIACMSGTIRDGYLLRDFSLGERLLTQPRVLLDYVFNTFLPNNARMGLFHDDLTLSRSLTSPWSTLPAILGLLAAVAAAIWLAPTRWWGVALGIMLFLSGHLIESSFIALELYFEHRNYLPSLGLLLAASLLIAGTWPWRQRLLWVCFGIYLLLLAASGLQRTYIWGDERLLLESSAHNHPHSLRAWTDYSENLLRQGRGREAIQASLDSAERNPEVAAVFYLQAVSIYCRSHQTPPPVLIQRAADTLSASRSSAFSLLTPLGIGLDFILTEKKTGHCGQADFSSLMPALMEQDRRLGAHYGPARSRLWMLRLTLAEWLLDSGRTEQALTILRDSWAQSNRADIPLVGLTLAQALAAGQHNEEELATVLAQLAPLTTDAPDDFKEALHGLQQGLRTRGTP